MENSVSILLFAIIFMFHISLVCNKDQRFNSNVDFLLHEAGGIPQTRPIKNDYDAQFPALGLPSTKSTVSSNNYNTPSTVKPQSSNRRDYVAPQKITSKPTSITTSKPSTNSFINSIPSSSSPKRDYVAAQYPTLKPLGTTLQSSNSFSKTTPIPATPPKRDYVAPQFPSMKQENTQNSGKVKDLVNFYDSKSQGGSTPPQKPSYSSIAQGSKNNHGSTITTPNPLSSRSPTYTTKPISFSSVVSGSNKPITGTTATTVITNAATGKPVLSNNQQSINRPSSPVLPSSIVNNNQNSKGSSPSDAELQALSEELLRKDSNNAAKYVTINYQEKTTSYSKDDKAPLPLLTINADVWNVTTIQRFIPLLDNYERDTLINEYVTSQERNEENAFMDAIMATSVIRHLLTFLKDKGYVSPDPKLQRDYLKQMWFGLYSRGKGKISSSGFEHIFVSELKNGEVSGLHNWIYFSKEEAANRVNYLGYLKYIQFNDKGAVLKMHFNQQGTDKPVGTMFVGTSPELEMALYTLCYVTRVDTDCNLKLGTKDVNIIAYNYRYRSKNYIGSAFPQI